MDTEKVGGELLFTCLHLPQELRLPLTTACLDPILQPLPFHIEKFLNLGLYRVRQAGGWHLDSIVS